MGKEGCDRRIGRRGIGREWLRGREEYKRRGEEGEEEDRWEGRREE